MSEIPLDLRYEPVMPTDRSPGIGCIGAGFIMADCHLVAYLNAVFNPVAIATRPRSRAEEAAERHGIDKVYEDYEELLADPAVEVVDIALPPDLQRGVVDRICEGYAGKIRGILAQKPLAMTYEDARHIVEACSAAGITLAVNQNMRFDHSIRAARGLLDDGVLGEPVLATIDMRAIPHWMPWQQRQGWVTLRIMSIHHLDTSCAASQQVPRVTALTHFYNTHIPHETGKSINQS